MLRVLQLLFVVLTCSGAGFILLEHASNLEEYTDLEEALRLRASDPPVAPDGASTAVSQWQQRMNSIRTNKWHVYDVGRGLVMFSACLLVAGVYFRVWRPRFWRFAETPKSKFTAMLLLALAWLSQVPAVWFYLIEERRRWVLPTWADNIIIPMIGSILLATIFFPLILAAAWFGFVKDASFPERILNKTISLKGPHKIVEFVVLLSSIILVFFIYRAIVEGIIILIPSLFVSIYIVWVLRACFLQSYHLKSELHK